MGRRKTSNALSPPAVTPVCDFVAKVSTREWFHRVHSAIRFSHSWTAKLRRRLVGMTPTVLMHTYSTPLCDPATPNNRSQTSSAVLWACTEGCLERESETESEIRADVRTNRKKYVIYRIPYIAWNSWNTSSRISRRRSTSMTSRVKRLTSWRQLNGLYGRCVSVDVDDVDIVSVYLLSVSLCSFFLLAAPLVIHAGCYNLRPVQPASYIASCSGLPFVVLEYIPLQTMSCPKP